MPLTRAQEAAALNHVVVTVMKQAVDGPIMKSLKNEIDDVSDLISLREIDIGNLMYPTAD
jgi:hypothetical protein